MRSLYCVRFGVFSSPSSSSAATAGSNVIRPSHVMDCICPGPQLPVCVVFRCVALNRHLRISTGTYVYLSLYILVNPSRPSPCAPLPPPLSSVHNLVLTSGGATSSGFGAAAAAPASSPFGGGGTGFGATSSLGGSSVFGAPASAAVAPATAAPAVNKIRSFCAPVRARVRACDCVVRVCVNTAIPTFTPLGSIIPIPAHRPIHPSTQLPTIQVLQPLMYFEHECAFFLVIPPQTAVSNPPICSVQWSK